jgi:hypothetical protein
MLFIVFFVQMTDAKKRNYVTGNGFKACADYIVENFSHHFTPEDVPAKSIIYIEVDSLGYFFNAIFPRIQNPIILISHNGDMPAPGAFATYLDDPRIIIWFGQNCDTTGHQKFYPIPIGIANARWKHGNTAVFDRILDNLPTEKARKKNNTQLQRIYINFSPETNPIRLSLHKKMHGKSFVSCCIPHRRLDAYLAEMAEHRYTLSPFGNGLDCHRTWEALLVGSLPIVQSSTLDPLYKELPVIIVQNREDITLAFLNKKYSQMQKTKHNFAKLYMDYWINIIKEYASLPSNITPTQIQD